MDSVGQSTAAARGWWGRQSFQKSLASSPRSFFFFASLLFFFLVFSHCFLFARALDGATLNARHIQAPVTLLKDGPVSAEHSENEGRVDSSVRGANTTTVARGANGDEYRATEGDAALEREEQYANGMAQRVFDSGMHEGRDKKGRTQVAEAPESYDSSLSAASSDQKFFSDSADAGTQTPSTVTDTAQQKSSSASSDAAEADSASHGTAVAPSLSDDGAALSVLPHAPSNGTDATARNDSTASETPARGAMAARSPENGGQSTDVTRDNGPTPHESNSRSMATPAATRDSDFGWSSVAGNTKLQDRMCQALNEDHQLTRRFVLFALHLVDANSFALTGQSLRSTRWTDSFLHAQQQPYKQHPDQPSDQEAGGVLGEQRWQEHDSQKEDPPQALTAFVPWPAVMKFISRLQLSALEDHDLPPQYAWESRAPCRLLPLVAAQVEDLVFRKSIFEKNQVYNIFLHHVRWSLERETEYLPTSAGVSERPDMLSDRTGSLVLPYVRAVNKLLEEISPPGMTKNSSTGSASWDTARMKRLAQSAPKLQAAGLMLERLINIAASYWSSYLVITDLEAGRTVEDLIEETAGHRINAIKRRYGDALYDLSETSKELIDGNVCGHMFLLLEGFVSRSVVDSMPWYNVEYFEAELLRYMQQELLRSMQPLEKAFSLAAVYDAERNAQEEAAVANSAAGGVKRQREGSHEPSQELEGEKRSEEEKNVKPLRKKIVDLFSAMLKQEVEVATGEQTDEASRFLATDRGREAQTQGWKGKKGEEQNRGRSECFKRRSVRLIKQRDKGDNSGNTLPTDNSNSRKRREHRGAYGASQKGVHRQGTGTLSNRRTQGMMLNNLPMPELRLTGYRVSTEHGIFHAGVVGESSSIEVTEKLQTAFTGHGVLLEIQLCQKPNSLLDFEDDDSDTCEGVQGEDEANDTERTKHSDKSTDMGLHTLNVGTRRRLDSTVDFLKESFTTSGRQHKVSSSASVFTDPPGARVSARQLRHKRAAFAAASGASAKVAEAAAAAAAAARKEASAEDDEASAASKSFRDSEGIAGTPPRHSSTGFARDAAANALEDGDAGNVYSRGEHSRLQHSSRRNSTPAGTGRRAGERGAPAPTAAAVPRADPLADIRNEDEGEQDPRLPVLLMMQAFSRYLGEGKPVWIFNKCRVLHSATKARYEGTSVLHHLMLEPDTDSDIHFFVNMPTREYSERNAEHLRQTLVRLGRAGHTNDADGGRAQALPLHLKDSRLRILGTAQRATDGQILKLQSFGLALDDNQRHNVDQLTGLANLRPYLPRGEEWRFMRADRLFGRILSQCHSFLEIPYAVKVQTSKIECRHHSQKATPRGGVPAWILAVAVLCTALPLLLFMCCLQFHGHMPTPWWLSCICSSRPPWGAHMQPRRAEQGPRRSTLDRTQSLSATSEGGQRYSQQAYQLREQNQPRLSLQKEEELQQREGAQPSALVCNPLFHGILTEQPLLISPVENGPPVKESSTMLGGSSFNGDTSSMTMESGQLSTAAACSTDNHYFTSLKEGVRRYSVSSADHNALAKHRELKGSMHCKRIMTNATTRAPRGRGRKLVGAGSGRFSCRSEHVVRGGNLGVLGKSTKRTASRGSGETKLYVNTRPRTQHRDRVYSRRTYPTAKTPRIQENPDDPVDIDAKRAGVTSLARDVQTEQNPLRGEKLRRPNRSPSSTTTQKDGGSFAMSYAARTVSSRLVRRRRRSRDGLRIQATNRSKGSGLRTNVSGQSFSSGGDPSSHTTKRNSLGKKRETSASVREICSIQDVSEAAHEISPPVTEVRRETEDGARKVSGNARNSSPREARIACVRLSEERNDPRAPSAAPLRPLLGGGAAYSASSSRKGSTTSSTLKRKGSPVDADELSSQELRSSFEAPLNEKTDYAGSSCSSSSNETTVRWRRSNTPLTQASTLDVSL